MPRKLLFALPVCAGLECVLNIELDGLVLESEIVWGWPQELPGDVGQSLASAFVIQSFSSFLDHDLTVLLTGVTIIW